VENPAGSQRERSVGPAQRSAKYPISPKEWAAIADGRKAARLTLPHTTPFTFAWDETFDVRMDTGTPVDDKDYQVPFAYSGKIDNYGGSGRRPSLRAGSDRLAKGCAERLAAQSTPNLPDSVKFTEKAENVGFQVRLLRQCFLDKLSPLIRHAPQKANNGGLFAPDLMTGFAALDAVWLSPRPFLSKADDFGI